ncbi:hypothetical protein QVD17_19717 [Tagetes erecta]|uniref:Uncharacterized protein n=1 Tax=Tagetes erecta TaxID=13708 RepID=A0AAD8KMT7_TARER|nr:hypothetical protein QVD17_19717 [Tagetes erecta]
MGRLSSTSTPLAVTDKSENDLGIDTAAELMERNTGFSTSISGNRARTARSLSSSSNGERDLEATSLICPKSQATNATAAKSADGVQRYRVILSVLRAFGNRQRKTVLTSSNAHSKQERWGKGAKRRERKVQFIESES